MKTRLIFGAGYLGGRVARRWLEREDRVVIVTRNETTASKWRSQGAETVIANIADPTSLSALASFAQQPIDTVLYSIGYDRNSGDDRELVSVGGPVTAAHALRGSFQQWIFASSTSVYGQTDGSWVDEDSPLEPATENGARCVRAEDALSATIAADRLLIVRLAGLYGPERLLARKNTLDSAVKLPGSGDQWLNLIHVDDAAHTIEACADRTSKGLLLVSDNEPVRRSDYYGLLACELGCSGPEFDDEPRTRRGAANKRCQNHKLRSIEGLRLQFPTYREGLASCFHDG